MPSPVFDVVVADNFHYMDEGEHYTRGRFAALAAAIAAARSIVDEYLEGELTARPELTAADLYERFTTFGDDPFIVGAAGSGVPFSAWDYAKQRCRELRPGADPG